MHHCFGHLYGDLRLVGGFGLGLLGLPECWGLVCWYYHAFGSVVAAVLVGFEQELMPVGLFG